MLKKLLFILALLSAAAFAGQTASNRISNPGFATATLTGNLTLVAGGATAASSMNQRLTASGGNRNVTLPAVADSYGLRFYVLNVGASNNIVVKNPSAATLFTATPGTWCVVVCDGATWAVCATSGGAGTVTGQVSLLTGVVDVLPVANGGTGLESWTGTGGLVYASSSVALINKTAVSASVVTTTAQVTIGGNSTDGTLRIRNQADALVQSLGVGGLISGQNGTAVKALNFSVATLNGGTPATVTVNLASVTANTRIFLSYGAKSATTLGVLEVSSRNNGQDFTITAFGSAVDISTVYWLALEP